MVKQNTRKFLIARTQDMTIEKSETIIDLTNIKKTIEKRTQDKRIVIEALTKVVTDRIATGTEAMKDINIEKKAMKAHIEIKKTEIESILKILDIEMIMNDQRIGIDTEDKVILSFFIYLV